MAREFFRIVRHKEITPDDFKSLRTQGRRLKDPAYEREWADGISVYDDFDRACEVARRYGYRQGSYIVKVELPESGVIEYRQTFEDPHHFTIYAESAVIMALVKGSPTRIPSAPGE